MKMMTLVPSYPILMFAEKPSNIVISMSATPFSTLTEHSIDSRFCCSVLEFGRYRLNLFSDIYGLKRAGD